MHTKDKLAAELLKVGLNEMADRAITGWYDDYLSPLGSPIVTLVDDLASAATKADINTLPAILALRKRAIDGDFDATKEESDAWAASPEGQAMMGMLGYPQSKKGSGA
jgi:hypothetical protein